MEMVWSENFHFKPFPDSRTKRARDHTQITPWTQIVVRLRLQIAPRSHLSTSLANPEAKIARLRLRLLCMPSTSPRSHPRIARLRLHRLRTPSTSPTSHAFDFAEMAPRRHWSHWDLDWEMVGFWWIWPNLMNFFWLGFDEFDQICVYLLRNCIIYLFGNWENVRKCKKQEENVFSILFSGTQPNTWKYFPFLKIAFPENIYFSENILHEPNTACEINT